MQWDNWDKFRTKVHETNLLVKPTASSEYPILCNISTTTRTEAKVPVLTCNPWVNGLYPFLVQASSDRVLWDLPPTGLVYLGDGQTARLIRNPIRQYKIGIDKHNTTATNIVTEKTLNFRDVVSSEGYQQLIQKKFFSGMEAMRILRSMNTPGAVPTGRNTCLVLNNLGLVSLIQGTEVVCWFCNGEANMLKRLPQCLLDKLVGFSITEFAREIVRDD